MSNYDDIILADGPKVYLPLDDTSGTTAAALAGPSGTYGGSPTLGVSGPSNINSNGFSTDGADDYMGVTVPTLGSAQPQSWECWVDAGVEWNTTNVLRFLYGPSASNPGFGISGNVTGAVANEVGVVSDAFSGAIRRTYWTGSTVPDEGWRHVVFTYSGTQGQWEWYIDGVNATDSEWGFTKSQNDSGSLGMAGNEQWDLARQVAGPNFSAFDGLAALAVYDYQLSASQILQHYNVAPPALKTVTGSVTVRDGAILHLPLDDVGGSVADAAVGSDGTYSGSPGYRSSGPSDIIPYSFTSGTGNGLTTSSIAGLGRSQPQSWEIWINTGYDTSDLKRIISSENPTVASNHAHIAGGNTASGLTNEVMHIWSFNDNNDDSTYWDGSTVSDAWHHHVWTFNGVQGGWEWYIDGANATSQGFTKKQRDGGAGGLANNQNWQVPGYYGSFAGTYDFAAFSVYSRELTPTEIFVHYQLGLSLWATSYSPVVV